jgi:hypothetical protein
LKVCITQLKYEKSGIFMCKHFRHIEERKKCGIVILGSLMKRVPEGEIRSILAHRPALAYCGSANDLIKVIEGIDVDVWVLGGSHQDWGPIPLITRRVLEKKEQMEKKIFTNEHKTHLLEQKNKTGL